MTSNLKVESGLQLLARLTKPRNIENYYPILLNDGPKPTDIIEITGESGSGKSFLTCELIAESLIPAKLGGAEAEVLLVITDGNISMEILSNLTKDKLKKHTSNSSGEELNNLFNQCFNRLHIIETFNTAQFHVTLHNLEKYLVDNPKLSLILFDTLTAYYWSEQATKVTKMDNYIKNILKLINKVTKDFRRTIIYTRPTYFVSTKSKDASETSQGNIVNYKISTNIITCGTNDTYEVTVNTINNINVKTFKIENGNVRWLN